MEKKEKSSNPNLDYIEIILNYLKNNNFSKKDIEIVKKVDEFIIFLKNNINKFKDKNNISLIKNNINNFKTTKYDLIAELFIKLQLYKEGKKIDISIINDIEKYLIERKRSFELAGLNREINIFNIEYEKYGLKTQIGDLDISLFDKNNFSIKELQNFLILKMGMFSLNELTKTDKIGKYGKRTKVLLYNYLRHKGFLEKKSILKSRVKKNISEDILKLIKEDILKAKKGEKVEIIKPDEIIKPENEIEITPNGIMIDDVPKYNENGTKEKENSKKTENIEKQKDSYENLLDKIINEKEYKNININSLKKVLLNISKTKLNNLILELKEINKKIKKDERFLFGIIKGRNENNIIESDGNFNNKNFSLYIPIIKNYLPGYEPKGNFGPLETKEIIEILLKLETINI